MGQGIGGQRDHDYSPNVRSEARQVVITDDTKEGDLVYQDSWKPNLNIIVVGNLNKVAERHVREKDADSDVRGFERSLAGLGGKP